MKLFKNIIIHKLKSSPHLFKNKIIPLYLEKYNTITYEMSTEIFEPSPYSDCYDYDKNEGINELPQSWEDCVTICMGHSKNNSQWYYTTINNYFESTSKDYYPISHCEWAKLYNSLKK